MKKLFILFLLILVGISGLKSMDNGEQGAVLNFSEHGRQQYGSFIAGLLKDALDREDFQKLHDLLDRTPSDILNSLNGSSLENNYFSDYGFLGHFLRRIDFDNREKFNIYFDLLRLSIRKNLYFSIDLEHMHYRMYFKPKFSQFDVVCFFIIDVVNGKYGQIDISQEVLNRLSLVFNVLYYEYRSPEVLGQQVPAKYPLVYYFEQTYNEAFRGFIRDLCRRAKSKPKDAWEEQGFESISIASPRSCCTIL